jgi:aspartate/methionine/tyrosine aminotransferase
LAADPSWDNYALIAEARRGATLRLVDMFDEQGINLDALKSALQGEAKRTGFVRVILNFPQNPTGYSPTKDEARQILAMLRSLAEGSAKVLVISDDAYFGLRFEDDIESQSLFAYLADMHENIFAAKVDGPTKEDFSWGLRCGFVTFAGKGLTGAHYDALIKKAMAVVRSTISCSSTVGQSLLKNVYATGGAALQAEREAFWKIIQGRYQKVRALVDARKDHSVLRPMPFNSGYFMSYRTTVDAEALRQALLHRYGIGTIAIDRRTLRVAFSGLEDSAIKAVYDAIYKAAGELSGK